MKSTYTRDQRQESIVFMMIQSKTVCVQMNNINIHLDIEITKYVKTQIKYLKHK